MLLNAKDTKCKKIDLLKNNFVHLKGEEAKSRCKSELALLNALIKDDVNAFVKLAEQEDIKEFSLFSTTSPKLHITPLMASIILDSQKIFKHIVENNLNDSLESILMDEYMSGGIFMLRDSLYDGNGLKALDFAAMYHRYDMFYTLLLNGANYKSPKYPQNSGILTFGDSLILELMLYFDGEFLNEFASGNIVHKMAKNDNVELLEYIVLQKHIKIDSINVGESALDIALSGRNFLKKPNIAMAKKLIALGAKQNEANIHRIKSLQEKNLWE